MTLACLASQSCSELGPAQPQLVVIIIGFALTGDIKIKVNGDKNYSLYLLNHEEDTLVVTIKKDQKTLECAKDTKTKVAESIKCSME